MNNAIPAFPANRAVFAQVMARAKAQFPSAQGMTKVGPDYVVMQEFGNSQPLIVKVTASEAAACGYVKV
jgi:hypothetical protein